MHFQKSTEPYDIYSTISSSLFERDGLKNTYIAYMLAWYGTRWLKVRCESAMAKCSLAHIRVGEPGADGKFELQWLIPRITKKKICYGELMSSANRNYEQFWRDISTEESSKWKTTCSTASPKISKKESSSNFTTATTTGQKTKQSEKLRVGPLVHALLNLAVSSLSELCMLRISH